MPVSAEALPKEFVLPDWDANILTVVRALIDPQSEARFVEKLQIGDPQILVLLVVDGMHREEAAVRCDLGDFFRHDIRLTSLAPSATAPVMTSVATAVSPRRHGTTGWVTWCREVGAMILPLPFAYEAGGDLAASGHAPERLFYAGPSFFEEMAAKTGRACFQAMPKAIAGTAFTRRMQRGAKTFPYAGVRHLFETVEWIVRSVAASGSRKAFLYAYIDALDQTQHRFGLAHPETHRGYAEIGKELKALARALQGKDAAVIVLSDHGFVDCPPEEAVFLSDHPRLAETLRLPLSGEPRFAYCHLKPGMEAAYLDYVADRLSDKFFPIPTDPESIRALFGEGPQHEQFCDRIGDFILAAKGGAALYDPLAGEPLKAFRGLHGSLLEGEMLIPLIVIRP